MPRKILKIIKKDLILHVGVYIDVCNFMKYMGILKFNLVTTQAENCLWCALANSILMLKYKEHVVIQYIHIIVIFLLDPFILQAYLLGYCNTEKVQRKKNVWYSSRQVIRQQNLQNKTIYKHEIRLFCVRLLLKMFLIPRICQVKII